MHTQPSALSSCYHRWTLPPDALIRLEPDTSFIIATIRGIPEGPPRNFPTPHPHFFPVLGF